jgi:signal peptidase I
VGEGGEDSGITEPPGVPPAEPVVAGTTEPAGPRRRWRLRRTGRERSFWRELPVLVVVAIGLALLIKTFLLQAFFIPSGSMEQTLKIGDRVLVNKLVYHLRSIHRGEIVVFNTHGTAFADATEGQSGPSSNPVVRGVQDVYCFLGFGCPGETDFIKRVIGIPGDTISCCNALGQVILNGKPLVEPYVYQPDDLAFCAGSTPAGIPDTGSGCNAKSKPVTVQPGMLFVMGDHRSYSADSRYYGQLPESKVVGRAFLRIWPLSRIAFLRVPSTFADHPALLQGGILAMPFLWRLDAARRRRRKRRRAGPSPDGS